MRLDASLADRALVILSPAILIGLGAWGAVYGGSVGGLLLVLGVVLGLIAGWVMPWSATVDATGIRRRTLLRSQTIPWDDVVAIERAGHRRRGLHRRDLTGRGSVLTHAPLDTHSNASGGSKGLTVRTVGRRRHVLATHAERPDQWDRLKELLADHAPGVAPPPPPATHPFSRR
jgi:hypothetical protein